MKLLQRRKRCLCERETKWAGQAIVVVVGERVVLITPAERCCLNPLPLSPLPNPSREANPSELSPHFSPNQIPRARRWPVDEASPAGPPEAGVVAAAPVVIARPRHLPTIPRALPFQEFTSYSACFMLVNHPVILLD